MVVFSEKTSQILKELETHKSALESGDSIQISNGTSPLNISNPDDHNMSSDSGSELDLNEEESGANPLKARRNSKLLRMESRRKWDSNDLDEQLAGMGEMYKHMQQLASPKSAE